VSNFLQPNVLSLIYYSHTGQVLLAKNLPSAAEETFTLIISADCVNMDQCNSVTELVVEVSTPAQAGPSFEKSSYKISVSESKPVGSKLLKVKAFASKSNGSIAYEITSGNDNNLVEINRNTGVVILQRSLDYDVVDSYRFVVRAQEESNGVDLPKLWNLTTVEMILEDDNDNEPKFLFSLYMGTVGENEPIGTTVCTIRAVDLDKGIYGKLQYSILDGDGKDKFVIAPSTGVVTTNTVFDYESKSRYYITVRANDIGGKASTARLQIEIDSRDEYSPQFLQKSYKFDIPRNAEPGHVVGRVEASDQDRGPDGRLTYQLVKPNPTVSVNRTNGALILKTIPTAELNSTLLILASSGRPESKSAVISVEIVLGEALKELEVASSAVADWLLGLLVTMLLLFFILCGIFVMIHLRNKKNSKKSKEEAFSTPSFDTLDYAPTTMRIGSTKQDSIYGSHYGNLMDLRGNERRRMNNTISELSDQSNSASSGRGSAEDGEEVEDEEICMINEGTLAQQQLRGTAGILDSGIQDEDDNLSHNSAKNTQEYLARLGIRPKMHEVGGGSGAGGGGGGGGSSHDPGNNDQWRLSQHPDGFDNLHLYEDKDGRGVDISALIYAQISEDMSHSASEDNNKSSNVGYKNVGQPSVTGSLSSIIHNEEELAGSYNWDYLLDWGPQYQPLAHVFSEIAHLKEDNSTRSEPTYCGIHSSRNTNSSGPSSEKGSTSGAGSISHHPQQGFAPSGGGGGGSARGITSTGVPRTGPLPPLPILPRSPIPNDISFASGPISPSFSPALSPLANRSPSISPLGGVATNSIRPSQFHHESCRSDSELGM
jgi:protocadherin-16/23